MRVRMFRPDGPIGVLLHCQGRSGAPWYWRVRLQNGDWLDPTDGTLIVDRVKPRDGDGLIAACDHCRLPFMGAPGEFLCDQCQYETFGRSTTPAAGSSGSNDAADPPRRRRDIYRRRSHF
jgi:hypothetical protein